MRYACWTLLLSVAAVRAEEPKPNAEQIEFFETKVRPVLIDNCFSCHGEKKQSGGLRLDGRKLILEGGDSGPAAIAGEPSKSLLVKAIRHEGDLKMPEKGKLPAEQIEILTAWVKMGVPYPAKDASIGKQEKAAAAKDHWAYKPRSNPPGDSIDQFISAKLKEQRLAMNQSADKRTLIRRLYYDLLGLPPKPEEVEAFEKDSDPKAYEKLIDRLLASPHYGERWGRHWLDYARYADTRGYLAGGVDRNYPYAYTYRDWVVRAFNSDMPYDRFVKLQLAADRYVKPDEPADLAALGFITVGRRFLGNANDVIDDRIDTVCRTFLGLTVACARCHDHKFDPIPTRDYYSLHGIFSSSVEPAELPLLEKPKATAERIAFEKELQKRTAAYEGHLRSTRDGIVAKLRRPETLAKYLLVERETRKKPAPDMQALLREKDLYPLVMTRLRMAVTDGKNADLFGLWNELGKLEAETLETEAPKRIAAAASRKDGTAVNPVVLAALQGAQPKSLAGMAAALGKALAGTDRAKGPVEERLAQITVALTSLTNEETQRLSNTSDRNMSNKLKAAIEQWNLKSPASPPRAMVVVDSDKPGDSRIQIRGNPGTPGAVAPRQFLEILSKERKPFKDGSGRKELAEAIVAKDNPLTARVMVNRIWLLHFGQGIVRTPSDFGVRSDPPTHPELLDWLANRFVEDGWSIKKLHKRILMSDTYRQSSGASDAQAKADPENRYLSHQNRRRLDFESLRDSLLATAGHLDETVGGRPVDLFANPAPTRRTIYGQIDRQNLPATMRAFDFASPDMHSSQRFQTTVPQQALFLMNSPFIAAQAHAVVERSEVARENDAARKVEELVRVVLGRNPSRHELELALRFIDQKTGDEPEAAFEPEGDWHYGYGPVDAKSGRVNFTPYPHYTGDAWQGGKKLPDPKIDWSLLNAGGGHPGDNPNHCAIRRWTAPAKMEIEIGGKLKHGAKEGDGVQGRIVSGRAGILLAKSVHNGATEMPLKVLPVEKGETIDFVVDCRQDTNTDGFAWPVTIKQLGGPRTWDSSRDFRGPAKPKPPAAKFTNWDQLAQALLLSNEFSFVD